MRLFANSWDYVLRALAKVSEILSAPQAVFLALLSNDTHFAMRTLQFLSASSHSTIQI